MRPSEFMQNNPVSLDISRSRFHMSPRWSGHFNSYELVPIFAYSDVLPGDTFRLGTSMAIRMSTPVVPVMDDLWLDVAYYFVPYDLLLSRSYMSPSTSDSNHSWKAFIGAQDSLLNMPTPNNGIELPHLTLNSTGYVTGGVADCMGLPNIGATGGNIDVNPLKFLAFMAVWNENYRDPNGQNPGVFSISSNQVQVTWNGLTGEYLIGKFPLPNVCRFHGYFGSALPWPQRNGVGITIPLNDVPVYSGNLTPGGLDTSALRWRDIAGNLTPSAPDGYTVSFEAPGAVSPISELTYAQIRGGSTLDKTYPISPANLWADLSNAALYVNTLRLAVQQQRWFEALARSGNNGLDVLTAGMFGVVRKDAGYNRVEYLGGKRIPVSVTQVNGTADTGTSVLGQTGAFSLTNDSDYYFTKSFDTWGCIIGVACVRYRDSFAQGISKDWTRFDKFDFYWPQFANLGEMPVLNREIYAADTVRRLQVFGYQEAWAEYRTMPDVVTGLLRPGQSYDHWTYVNNFLQTPSLGSYIKGDGGRDNVDRTLLVSSQTSGYQFVGQFQFDITAVRPVPTYSIPGLVDHH